MYNNIKNMCSIHMHCLREVYVVYIYYIQNIVNNIYHMCLFKYITRIGLLNSYHF